MARLPARVASPRWVGVGTMTALEVTDLSRGLRLVTFAGAALAGRAWSPGQEIQVQVAPAVRRHYTPVTFDTRSGRCRVVFQLIVPGPGTRWARRLIAGDEVSFCGPRGGVRHLPGGRHLYLGDGTALGAFRALLDHARPDVTEVLGAVEVPPHNVDAARSLVPELTVLAHDGAPGAALGRWLHDAVTGPRAARPDACRLIGHANSLRGVRRQLVQAGVPRRNVDLKPYWATGRTGL